MEDEILDDDTPTTDPAAPPAPAPASATTPAAATSAQTEPAPAPAPATDGRTVVLPSDAVKRMRDEERRAGERAALANLDARAQAEGFGSHAEMLAFASAQRAAAAAQPPAPAQTPAPAPQDPVAVAQAERDKAVEATRKLNRERAKLERENRRLQTDLLEQQALTELKIAAKDAGLADVDYAVEIFRRTAAKLPEAEQHKLDQNKFFREELRKSHPYLYVAVDKPVHTGPTDHGTTPPPAKPDQTKPTTEKVDANKMSPEQFRAHLAKRGLRDPQTGGMLR